jgi:hypothetical protein
MPQLQSHGGKSGHTADGKIDGTLKGEFGLRHCDLSHDQAQREAAGRVSKTKSVGINHLEFDVPPVCPTPSQRDFAQVSSVKKSADTPGVTIW